MRAYFVLLTLLVVSCKGTNEDTTDQGTIKVTEDSVLTDTTIITEPLNLFDSTKTYTASILNATLYHSDEVMENVEELEWMGLFRPQEGSCYLRKTAIQALRVEDAIVDREGEKTAWELSTDNEDAEIILINNLDFLQEGEVSEVKMENRTVEPGQQLMLDFGGQLYTLKAEGEVRDNYGRAECFDYKLTVEAKIKGEKKKTTLISVEYFDLYNASLLFVGDIDQDGVLDFLINSTNHYNVYLPTLFLSRPAKQAELLYMVGQHRSVGC